MHQLMHTYLLLESSLLTMTPRLLSRIARNKRAISKRESVCTWYQQERGIVNGATVDHIQNVCKNRILYSSFCIHSGVATTPARVKATPSEPRRLRGQFELRPSSVDPLPSPALLDPGLPERRLAGGFRPSSFLYSSRWLSGPTSDQVGLPQS